MSDETDYTSTVTTVTVHPRGSGVNDERATVVRLEDEGGGAFVEVEQSGRDDLGKISIDPDEWPEIRRAIDEMMAKAEAMT